MSHHHIMYGSTPNHLHYDVTPYLDNYHLYLSIIVEEITRLSPIKTGHIPMTLISLLYLTITNNMDQHVQSTKSYPPGVLP